MNDITKELYVALRDLDSRLKECFKHPISAQEAYDSFYQESTETVLKKYTDMNDINSGLDALQDSIEKRVSRDVQTLEDSEHLWKMAIYFDSIGRATGSSVLANWASILRRIAIPRPVGERE